MKQHITVNQWNELAFKIQEKTVLEEDHIKAYDNWLKSIGLKHSPHFSKQITIGKMIEILSSNNKTYYLSYIDYNAVGDSEFEVCLFFITPKGRMRKEFVNQELCDALWEAVKSVLVK